MKALKRNLFGEFHSYLVTTEFRMPYFRYENTKWIHAVVLLMFIGFPIFANPVGNWEMDEGQGQQLKNSINIKESGWLGNSIESDDSDPSWVKDDSKNALYFEAGKFVEIPDGTYSDFTGSQGFSIQLWFKPTTTVSRENGRIQLLTKGADSAVNNWQLRLQYVHATNKNMLTFLFKDGKDKSYTVETEADNILDRWNRVTVTGNGRQLKLYLNGKLTAENSCDGLPRITGAPLKVGIYAFGDRFGFAGYMRDLKVFKSEIKPEPFKEDSSTNMLLTPAGNWKMDEGLGQQLKNSVNINESGWLGNSIESDDSDPSWIKDNNKSVLYFEAGKFAEIPNGTYSDFTGSQSFSIQLWFKPTTTVSRENGRIQLLTKGADSAVNNWQLRLQYVHATNKNMLTFVFKDGKDKSYTVETGADNILDRWNRVTVTGNGENLKLYLNGKLSAESSCDGLPRINNAPLKLGIYAFGAKFGFSGYMKGLKIFKSEIKPEPLNGHDPTKVLLDNDFSVSSPEAWNPIDGKWFWRDGAYCEFSDVRTTNGIWSFAGTEKWANYCLDTTIDCADSLGSVLLGVGWQDIDNHYQVKHERFNSGMVALSVVRVKDGYKSVLAEIDNTERDLPAPKLKQDLNYKVFFYNGIIAVWINGKFYLSISDHSFDSGKVAIGGEERKIKIKRVKVQTLTEFSNPVISGQVAPQTLKITSPALRHAFFRGEQIQLNLTLLNNTGELLPPSRVKLSIDNGIETTKMIDFPAIKINDRINEKFMLDTNLWKSGDYKVSANLEGTDQQNSYSVFIAPAKRQDTFRFFSWGGRADAPFCKSLQEHGFNGFSLPVNPFEDLDKQKRFFSKAMDNAVRYGQNLKINYNCLFTVPIPELKVTRYDGSRGRATDPWNPTLRKKALEGMKKTLKFFDSHPAISGFLLNSEVENMMEPDYSTAGRSRFIKELGFEMPVPENRQMEKDGTAGRVVEVPQSIKDDVPPVFSEDNHWYQFFKWFWQRGYGDNYLNAELNNLIKEKFPNSKTCHDPFRDVPLFFRNKGLDMVGTWFYPHPDASETLGIAEVLNNAARDEEKTKGINFGSSLWLYDNRICPAQNRHAGVQPTDIIIESDWLAFSRIPGEIEHYTLTYLMPEVKLEFKPKDIYAKLGQFSKEVLQPFWPTVSRLRQRPRQCAMLLSFGSQLFGSTTWGGYGYSSAFGYYAALQMAHIPTDIIFDENVQRGDLDKYKILFMHNVTHLPKGIFERICKFAENGGTVICGTPFAKLIPKAIEFDMDMSKRKKSSYYSLVNKNGYTADIVYDDMIQNAESIQKLVGDRIEPYATCDSSSVFLNVLERDDAKYIFVINDKRTFGDYVGKKYRAVMEQGLPQKATIKLRTANSAVYDLLKNQELEVIQRDNTTTVTVDLNPGWGTIIAVYPEKIKKVEISMPQNLISGQKSEILVKIISENGTLVTGVQPLSLIITDPRGNINEYSGYYATIGGEAKIKMIPAQNDLRGKWQVVVKELSSGIEKRIEFPYQ